MAKNKLTLRGYYAYLKRAKKEFDVTHKQAQAMYRQRVADTGRPVNSSDLKRHPRISKRLAVEVSKPVRKRAVGGTQVEGGGSAGGGGGKRVAEKPASRKRIRTIREWEELDFDDTEDVVLNAGVDSGKAKKK